MALLNDLSHALFEARPEGLVFYRLGDRSKPFPVTERQMERILMATVMVAIALFTILFVSAGYLLLVVGLHILLHGVPYTLGINMYWGLAVLAAVFIAAATLYDVTVLRILKEGSNGK